MALISIEFKDDDFKKIMEDLRTAEELTFKAHRNLSALGVVSVGADPKRDEIPQDLQEALNEEFLTDPQTLKCHSETIQGLIVNLIMGAGLNQFDINKQTRMFLISALMYGRAALMAAPDLSHEIEREIEALRDFCKRYYDPE